ncbi:MAG: hypothetical protein LBH25_09530 [Fibromonadaceae bacterium]|jgi:uncharacterized coiled-coil protein SlyX|nr:hypothetical protein [Fibromonadaceae bacterium]
MEQIASPEVSKALIESGHVWAYIMQFLCIAVLIPVGKWFINYSASKTAEKNELNKKLIDAEREITKRERDSQMEKLDNRITVLEKDIRMEMGHIDKNIKAEITELKYTLENSCKAIEKVGNKMDMLYSKVHGIS